MTQFDGTRPNWSGLCPDVPLDLVLLTPPAFGFVRRGAPDQPTDLANLCDPYEYITAMEGVIRGAASVLVPGGVLVTVVQSTADFGGKGPVPNIVGEVARIIDDAIGENFLGWPVVRFGRRIRRADHDGEWLVPEVWHVIAHRKA